MSSQTTAPREIVASFEVEQVRSDRWPVVLVHYTGSRGTRRTSECKWNTIADARRHGARLYGLVMR